MSYSVVSRVIQLLEPYHELKGDGNYGVVGGKIAGGSDAPQPGCWVPFDLQVDLQAVRQDVPVFSWTGYCTMWSYCIHQQTTTDKVIDCGNLQ
jgi:hypothetical protein